MSTVDLQQSMTTDDRAKFDRGAKLLGELQKGKHFDDYWVPIGQGAVAVRHTVMRILHLNQPRGGHYNGVFNNMLNGTPYADLDKSERSHLLFCMDNLAEIFEMRSKWTPRELRTVNTPVGMARRLREFLKPPPPHEEAPKRNVSPMAALREKNEDLTRTVGVLTGKLKDIERRDGSLFDLKLDTPEDIAEAIVANITEIKAKKIHKTLGEALKRKRSKQAG